jgi:hypothetical protein
MWPVLVAMAFAVGFVFGELKGRKFVADAKQVETDLKQLEESIATKGAADRAELLAFIARLRSVL